MDLTNLQDSFLQQDLHKAFEEYICAMNCMYLQSAAFENGDFITTLRMSENATRSIRELAKMQEAKRLEDALTDFTRKLEKEERFSFYVRRIKHDNR